MNFNLCFKIIFSAILLIFSLNAYGQNNDLKTSENKSQTNVLIDSSTVIKKNPSRIDYTKLGQLLWYGTGEIKSLDTNPNIFCAVAYSCLDSGWVKYEATFDTLKGTKYDKNSLCFDIEGDTLWTEKIEIKYVDTTKITIKCPIEAKVEIYKAYTLGKPIEKLILTSALKTQTFKLNLPANSKYVAVFINNKNEIVNIKRIKV